MINLFRNILKKGFFITILKKLIKRTEKTNSKQATKWAASKVKLSTEKFCQSIDRQIYEETVIEAAKIKIDGEIKLSSIGYKLGGAGNYFLLYFLVRKFCPKIVIETGVAAGWTTLSILRALDKNQVGKLYSSDFPYFRNKDPEKIIGILVKDETNLDKWDLDIRGDNIALTDFKKKLADSSIDLLHYDSDKSYSGRTDALNLMKNKFSENVIMIFDDIQDNLHFHDLVTEKNMDFTILSFEGKYVGIVGIQKNLIINKL